MVSSGRSARSGAPLWRLRSAYIIIIAQLQSICYVFVVYLLQFGKITGNIFRGDGRLGEGWGNCLSVLKLQWGWWGLNYYIPRVMDPVTTIDCGYPESGVALYVNPRRGRAYIATEGGRRWVNIPMLRPRRAQTGLYVVNYPSAFIRECCDISPDETVSCGDLWRAFQDWCVKNGHYCPRHFNEHNARRADGDIVMARKITRRSPGRQPAKFWLGIGLKKFRE